jgi:esterase/lipase
MSMQRVYFGLEKKPHGVLLIHGIPSSTSTSTGSLIATWLSAQREVESLVLIVPNFSPGPSAARYKVLLDTPVASQILKGVMP